MRLILRSFGASLLICLIYFICSTRAQGDSCIWGDYNFTQFKTNGVGYNVTGGPPVTPTKYVFQLGICETLTVGISKCQYTATRVCETNYMLGGKPGAPVKYLASEAPIYYSGVNDSVVMLMGGGRTDCGVIPNKYNYTVNVTFICDPCISTWPANPYYPPTDDGNCVFTFVIQHCQACAGGCNTSACTQPDTTGTSTSTTGSASTQTSASSTKSTMTTTKGPTQVSATTTKSTSPSTSTSSTTSTTGTAETTSTTTSTSSTTSSTTGSTTSSTSTSTTTRHTTVDEISGSTTGDGQSPAAKTYNTILYIAGFVFFAIGVGGVIYKLWQKRLEAPPGERYDARDNRDEGAALITTQPLHYGTNETNWERRDTGVPYARPPPPPAPGVSAPTNAVVGVVYDGRSQVLSLQTRDVTPGNTARSGDTTPSVGAASVDSRSSRVAISVEGITVFEASDLQTEYQLGEGGFGVVTLVRDRRLRTPMALKTFKGSSPSVVESFIREATVMFNLHHPCCLRVMGICVKAGEFGLLTEYMDQGDLGQAMPRLQSLGVPAIIPILTDICTGLAYLHGKGMAHADIKPANVLMNGRGGVVLADFGLVGFSGRACTPFYAAPEVLLTAAVSDARADIFSFGVLAWQMFAPAADLERRRGAVRVISQNVTNGPVYGSSEFMRAVEDLACSPLTAFSIPAALRGLIEDCLSVSPAQRPSSVTTLERLLAQRTGAVRDATLAME